MHIDWGTAGITAAIAVIALIGGMYAVSGRHAEKFITIFKRLDGHDSKHKEHDSRFEKMPEHFVPRTELEARLKTIEQNSEEIKRLLNWLVFYRAQQAPTPGKVPAAPEMPPGA
jgi:hypothetical protein